MSSIATGGFGETLRLAQLEQKCGRDSVQMICDWHLAWGTSNRQASVHSKGRGCCYEWKKWLSCIARTFLQQSMTYTSLKHYYSGSKYYKQNKIKINKKKHPCIVHKVLLPPWVLFTFTWRYWSNESQSQVKGKSHTLYGHLPQRGNAAFCGFR